MTCGRQLYLSTYGAVDTIDQKIKNCNMYYRSWKYWHSAKNHFTAMAIVVAYDMYTEVMLKACKKFGFTVEEGKRLHLDFHQFREKLARHLP